MSMWYGDVLKTLRTLISALTSGIAKPPEGRKVTKFEFTYDADNDITQIKAYENDTLLFTLTFEYDQNKNITSIKRE